MAELSVRDGTLKLSCPTWIERPPDIAALLDLAALLAQRLPQAHEQAVQQQLLAAMAVEGYRPTSDGELRARLAGERQAEVTRIEDLISHRERRRLIRNVLLAVGTAVLAYIVLGDPFNR